MRILVSCAYCGVDAAHERGAVARAKRNQNRLYCSRKCSGLGRRKNKTKTQLVEEKRIYDAQYRARNLAWIKAKKAAHFKLTYDPAQAAVVRKKRMPMHVKYCQQPEYKKWKCAYDKKHRAKKYYGPFAEVAILVMDLNREIKGRASNHEIKWENKTANKSQFRRREDKTEKPRSRPRQRYRRHGHSAALGA